MVGAQVAIIFVGGAAFSIRPIDGKQWAICVLLASLSLPMGVLIRCFPDEWFGVVAHHVGGPFRTAYRAVKRVFSRVWAKLPKKSVKSETSSMVEDVPQIRVEGARDIEKGIK